MESSSHLEIDLKQLSRNIGFWREVLASSDSKVCAVIKADAYGLGAARLAPHLERMGVDMFCVYNPQQAELLLSSGSVIPVLVLQSMGGDLMGTHLEIAASEGRLHLNVDSLSQLPAMEQFAMRARGELSLHLHLDTGMSRAGMSQKQFLEALQHIADSKWLKLAGLMTHYATAREDVGYMNRQSACFDRMVNEGKGQHPKLFNPEPLIHVASTVPTCRGSHHHRNMVRIGLGLYGYGMETIRNGDVTDCVTEASDDFQPVVEWHSKVVHIQRYPQGTPIGYSCTHYLMRNSLIGVIPVGYGDGYPIALSNQAEVEVLDNEGNVFAKAPVVGKVSMDQITVDLTEAEHIFDKSQSLDAGASQRIIIDDHKHPDSDIHLPLGLRVRLISKDRSSPCAMHNLAKLSNTTNYEMLCRISHRVPRRYLGVSGVNLYGPTSKLNSVAGQGRQMVEGISIPRGTQSAQTSRATDFDVVMDGGVSG